MRQRRVTAPGPPSLPSVTLSVPTRGLPPRNAFNGHHRLIVGFQFENFAVHGPCDLAGQVAARYRVVTSARCLSLCVRTAIA